MQTNKFCQPDLRKGETKKKKKKSQILNTFEFQNFSMNIMYKHMPSEKFEFREDWQGEQTVVSKSCVNVWQILLSTI